MSREYMTIVLIAEMLGLQGLEGEDLREDRAAGYTGN